jgi:hypothetical protein
MSFDINSFLKSIARKILSEELESYSSMEEENTSLKENNEALVAENLSLETQLENEDESNELINEYPSKLVYYNGRVLPLSSKNIKVPVTVLITPTDGKIIQDLKDWKLYQINEDIETWIPKIYKKVMSTYYSYKYDEDTWGLSEFWEFPFELFAKYPTGKINADCDSFSILLVSYIRAAGVPAGYVWSVAGNTYSGEGHSTVYCYSPIDGKYHHLNSTSTIYYKNVSDYPTHADAESGKDDIGIASVWLSFNDIVSRSTFSTSELEKIMEQNKK